MLHQTVSHSHQNGGQEAEGGRIGARSSLPITHSGKGVGSVDALKESAWWNDTVHEGRTWLQPYL